MVISHIPIDHIITGGFFIIPKWVKSEIAAVCVRYLKTAANNSSTGCSKKKCAVYRSLTLSGHKSVSFQVKTKLRQFSNTSGQVESETVFKFLSNAAVYQVISAQIEFR